MWFFQGFGEKNTLVWSFVFTRNKAVQNDCSRTFIKTLPQRFGARMIEIGWIALLLRPITSEGAWFKRTRWTRPNKLKPYGNSYIIIFIWCILAAFGIDFKWYRSGICWTNIKGKEKGGIKETHSGNAVQIDGFHSTLSIAWRAHARHATDRRRSKRACAAHIARQKTGDMCRSRALSGCRRRAVINVLCEHLPSNGTSCWWMMMRPSTCPFHFTCRPG